MGATQRQTPFFQANLITISQNEFAIIARSENDALLALNLHKVCRDLFDLVHEGQFWLAVLRVQL